MTQSRPWSTVLICPLALLNDFPDKCSPPVLNPSLFPTTSTFVDNGRD